MSLLRSSTVKGEPQTMGDQAIPTAPTDSVFAPHFVPDDTPAPQRQAPSQIRQESKGNNNPGFAAKMVDAADNIAKELGVDTSAVDRADGRDSEPVPDYDPLGEAELEIAPGKRIKRKEIVQQLAQYEALQKKQKEFERASHQRMQQAAEERKRAHAMQQQANEAIAIKQRLEELVSSGADEDTILREFGKDPEKYWQSKLERQYQDLQKTPEQRQMEALQAREHALRQREQQFQQQEQQKQDQVRKYQEEQATNQQAEQLQNSFMQTADKLKLPRTALTIQRFANLMASAAQAGIDVTMDQLGAKVRDMYRQEAIEQIENMTENDGFQSLPKTVQDKIRRSMLAKLGNPTAPTPVAGQAAPRTKQAKPMSTAEYNDYINKLRTKGG